MRHLLLGLAFLLAPTPAHAQDGSDSTDLAHLVTEQAKSAGIAYPQVLAAAKAGDPTALRQMFRVTLAVNGPGAAWHGGQLWDLLQRWGDSAYTAVLAPESAEMRERVLCLVRMEACDPRNAEWYSRTFALDPRREPCECDS